MVLIIRKIGNTAPAIVQIIAAKEALRLAPNPHVKNSNMMEIKSKPTEH